MPLRHTRLGRRDGRTQMSGAEPLRFVAFPVLVTAFAFVTGTGAATLEQALFSLLLLQIAWASWVSWQAKLPSQKDFPVFPILAGMYWLAYGLPLFWNLPQSWRFGSSFASSGGVIRAQALALLGIVSLYFGMHLGVGRRLRQTPTLDLRDSTASPKYVMAAMFFGVSLRYFPSLASVLGSSLRQVFMILRNTLPLVAYSILLRRSLMRWVPLYERVLMVVFVLGTFLFGLATGWLGTGAVVIMITGCVLLDTRFTIPKMALVAVVAYILFLQPAKEQFRKQHWDAGSQTGDVSQAADWLSLAQQKWESAWSDSDPVAVRQQLYVSMNRFSLLQQTANVMDLTPSMVPHQGWKMYSYMADTLIPRAIWPNKPSMNDANRFYQVMYGMTTERDLDGVSISVGTLAESYISFGWMGTFAVMTLIGVVLDCVVALLLSRDAGVLMKGIGIALLPGLTGVESQMAQYLGGIIQAALLPIIVMLPFVQVTPRGKLRRTVPRSPVNPPVQPLRLPRVLGPSRAVR
jgi:hypothetical protein